MDTHQQESSWRLCLAGVPGTLWQCPLLWTEGRGPQDILLLMCQEGVHLAPLLGSWEHARPLPNVLPLQHLCSARCLLEADVQDLRRDSAGVGTMKYTVPLKSPGPALPWEPLH